jgi:hypothetical protein
MSNWWKITPLGTAIKGIKIVASFIASIVIIDSVIGGVILGSEHGYSKWIYRQKWY